MLNAVGVCWLLVGSLLYRPFDLKFDVSLRRATIYLMAPCVAWVTFASALNLEIALLN